ncbi:hypothetical protein KGD82_13805 [Nocardiopsis eucommiae]|uniref:Uncharacterized protein n=1 Tax=Nocardiopsis eucommiae TaxID=2831970 RepID=A0A975LCI0_9ACTN|nr:hypothetical protein KGD82_13805 [Nocardiopsis eucommiae]
MKENRWGGASGPTNGSTRGGRIKRGAAKARDWADDKTGRRMSTGWRAARGQEGFKARRRAAGQAVKNAGGGGFIAGIVGVLAAIFAGFASLFGGLRKSDEKPTTEKPTTGQQADKKASTAANGAPSVAAADAPAGEDAAPSPSPSGDADTSTEPTATPSTTTTTGDTMTSNAHRLPHAASAAELNATVAKSAPEDLFAVIDQAREWPDFVQDNTLSIRRYVQQIQGNRIPLGPDSIQALQDFFALHGKLMEAAQAIHPVMTKEHASDLERREHQRGDERKANV